jgi:hypothetical protein
MFADSIGDGFGPYAGSSGALGVASAAYSPFLSALRYPLSVASAVYNWVSTGVDGLWSDQALYGAAVAKASANVATRILETDWSMDGDEVI